jgi:hypothetical protein
MPKTAGSFKAGHKGFKPKGAVNRTTKEAKEFLEFIMFGQMDNMMDALNTLYEKDQARYLDACSKLFTYVLPKKTDITSGDDKILQSLPTMVIKCQK